MHIVIIFQPHKQGNTNNQKQHKKPTSNKKIQDLMLKSS